MLNLQVNSIQKSMESAQICLECGLPIPEGMTGNHCPNCLFRLAFLPSVNGSEGTQNSGSLPTVHPRYFAGYELLSEIAFGGMGVVWKARQLGVNRPVALKMIPAGHLASPQMRLRFRIEIETVVLLDHPHIVPVYETGEHDGQHYFSMKLLEGGNLRDWIDSHPIGTSGPGAAERNRMQEAVRLLITVTRAVHHAHQRGILHRDLKPSNILLDHEGKPYVADFGLAKVLGRDSGLTLSESALGSPNYMAPEQASGHPTQLSVAADVYGLGAILFDLLTGRPPFQGATAVETMRKVVDEDASSPRQLNPEIDADLETICLKCLQKEPSLRYESADALADDLERWLSGHPISARPVGPLRQFLRWCRRQPALATALGLSLLLLLIVVVGTVIAGVRIAQAERRAAAHLRESLLGQTRIVRFSSEMGRRNEGLELIREAAALGGPSEFRQELRHELLALLARTEVTFVPQPELRCSPDTALNALSPRGDRLATVRNRHTVVILDTSDGRALTQFTVPEPIQALENFSSDTRFLGFRHAQGAGIWDLTTGRACFSTNQPSLVFAFAPNAPLVFLQSGRKVASICEMPSMREVRVLAPYSSDTVRVSWSSLSPSPDGSMLAAIRRGSRIVEVIDLQTGRLLRNLTNDGRAFAVTWSGNSARLGVSTTARRAIVWDVNGGKQVYLTSVLPALSQTLALDHSAHSLVTGGADGIVRFFNRSSPRPCFELPGETPGFSFSADATRLQPFFRNGMAGSLVVQRPNGYFDLPVAETDNSLAACRFSADGQILAVGNRTNVTLCTAREGTVLTNLVWNIQATCFDPKTQSVMAAGVPGMFRWAMHRAQDGNLFLSAEQQVLAGAGWRSFGYSSRGDVFVAANVRSNTAFLFDRNISRVLSRSGSHVGLEFVTPSPNGRWIATGSELDRQIRVWDMTQHREVMAIPGGLRPQAVFSPDGKWFAAFGIGFQIREVPSWKKVQLFRDHDHAPVLGAAAFSPDERTLAVVADMRSVRLIDLVRFETLAILRPPHTTQIHALAFSPDNTRLAAVTDSLRLCVWNLPALNRELSKLGLEWNSADGK